MKKQKKLIENIKQIDDWLDSAQRICTKTDGKTKYKFRNFTFPLKFTSKIYRRDLTQEEAEDDQQKLKILINKLNNDYNPKHQTKIKEKDDALKSTKNCFKRGKRLLVHLKKLFFRNIDGFQVEKETDEKADEKSTLENEEINTTDMPELESEESAAERRNQQGKGFKILTPNQMLRRLPISLAQLKAGNNLEKLKNETRQL